MDMDLSDPKVLDKMYASATLLGDPAAGVVRALIGEVRRQRVMLANVACIDPTAVEQAVQLGAWEEEPSRFRPRVRYARYTASPLCPRTTIAIVVDYRGPQPIEHDANHDSDPSPWSWHMPGSGGPDAEDGEPLCFASAQEAMADADRALVKMGWILP